MKRPLFFSALVALTVHGALFFIRPRVEAIPAKIAPPREPTTVVVVPLDPPEPQPATSDDQAPKRTGDPLTGLEDTPSPVENPVITMDLTPTRPKVDGVVNRIDPASVGVDSLGDRAGIRTASVLSSTLLDKQPRTRSQAAPLYPTEARREGRGGTVTVEFIVDEQGRVTSPEVVSSTSREFEEAAVRAVQKWRFEPGRRDGRVVRFKMSVPVVFSISAD